MSFAQIAKDLREGTGLSQQKLSKKIGISASGIGHLELGRNEPTASTLILYSKFFNVPVEELLEMSGFTPEERAAGASPTRTEKITPIEDELLYSFRRVGKKHGEETQRAIITMIEKMLS